MTDLDPPGLWKHFHALTRIPRPSGQEQDVAKYIADWAKQHGFIVKRDKAGNACVYVPATSGSEEWPALVIQGHMDMVCEKESSSQYDAATGNIRLVREGDWLCADGTTLGADNGIGMAAMLHIAESKEAAHGPLDLLFTVEEETGLVGARGLDPSLLRGRTLLNLDSEEDGILCIGCSGGVTQTIEWRAQQNVNDAWVMLTISVRGLLGGHSGMDINKHRLNAIRAIARLLRAGSHGHEIALVSIDGGNKSNAIPRDCSVRICISPDQEASLLASIATARNLITEQVGSLESNLQITAVRADPGTQGKIPQQACSPDDSKLLLNFIHALPTGVIEMSADVPNFVETSTNFASIATDDDTIRIVQSSRSSVPQALREVLDTVAAAAHLAKATMIEGEGYPGWRPDLKSKALAATIKAFHAQFGHEPKIEMVHAGLECGVIGQRVPGMDMISFGPTIRGPHAPGEAVNVPSVSRFWQLFVAVVQELGQRP